MFGAGIALLLAKPRSQRSAAQSRLTLVAIGALTTIPLAMIVLLRRRHVQG